MSTFRHGMSHSKTHKAWSSMKARCLNKNNKGYPYYGGRGILICDSWMKFEGFLEDMGIAPEGMTLERVDVNGGYNAGNCVWASMKQQQNNKRTNVLVTYEGETKNLSQWASHFGITKRLFLVRLHRGWSFEDAIKPKKILVNGAWK